MTCARLPGFAVALLTSGAVFFSSCSPSPPADSPPDAVAHLRATVLAVHPFNESSFTQGLEVDAAGNLLIGTGRQGASRIYRTTVVGTELQSVALDEALFGEGITRSGSDIWQLTWQDHLAIRRDATTLAETQRVPLATEGWGICRLADSLVYSDGSATLRTLDPESFELIGELSVTEQGVPVTGLNELECVGNEIYANIFTTTDIVRIDAQNGQINARIDASGLPNRAAPDPNNVLNGIAAIPGTDRFYLAGKRWPDLYEVRFEPVGSA